LKAELQSKKSGRLVREIIETIIITVILFVAINLVVQNYDVDGLSMEPSLHNQERIMVDKVSYHLHAPARGDVIVFKAPPEPTKDYVKRIIALPGDRITVDGTTVKVNNVTLNETYVAEGYNGNPYAANPINEIVPPNDYFVMGDDRKNSSDSREWGFVPSENIIGRAALVYWPLNQSNSGLLPNVASVFAHVPQTPAKTQTPLENSHPLPGTFGSDVLVLCFIPGIYLFRTKSRKKR